MKFWINSRLAAIAFLTLTSLAATPAAANQNSGQTGMASYYGPKFHGKKTASGERFNQNAMTAAHRTAPFGSQLKVTNVASGKSVVVRVNDRGPFIRGRIVDVSTVAARQLGLVQRGVGRVRVQRL